MMDAIDVHDLPEEQVRLVQEFVEFLRRKLREAPEVKDAEAQEQDWAASAVTSFAKDWDNAEDAVYDHWREHHHVSEG